MKLHTKLSQRQRMFFLRTTVVLSCMSAMAVLAFWWRSKGSGNVIEFYDRDRWSYLISSKDAKISILYSPGWKANPDQHQVWWVDIQYWLVLLAVSVPGAIAAPFWIRYKLRVNGERFRIANNLCLKCGYSRAGIGNLPCPECGFPPVLSKHEVE